MLSEVSRHFLSHNVTPDSFQHRWTRGTRASKFPKIPKYSQDQTEPQRENMDGSMNTWNMELAWTLESWAESHWTGCGFCPQPTWHLDEPAHIVRPVSHGRWAVRIGCTWKDRFEHGPAVDVSAWTQPSNFTDMALEVSVQKASKVIPALSGEKKKVRKSLTCRKLLLLTSAFEGTILTCRHQSNRTQGHWWRG